ncbi:MAG: helicase-related protein [Promethearchaeota archaeon]
MAGNGVLGDTLFEPGDLVPRDYQVELARRCSSASHLVVLPTGLGKTLIAAMVAGRILAGGVLGGKVVVLAPTRPLVSQHVGSFREHLAVPESEFAVVTGQVPPGKRPAVFRARRVLFMTPETLRNDLEKGRYDLSDVGLLVFDEAHHARGDYAYTSIARHYARDNPSGVVLGLTASPGSSRGKVEEVVTNLGIPVGNVVAMDKRDSEVERYVQKTTFQRVPVELPPLFLDVLTTLRQFLTAYRGELDHLCSSLGVAEPKACKNAKGVAGLLRQFQRLIALDPENKGNYLGAKLAGNTLRVHHYVDVVETQGLDVFLNTLAKHMEEARKPRAAKGLREFASDARVSRLLSHLAQVRSVEPRLLVHPKIAYLERELEGEFAANRGTRVLVFAKLRETVNLLVEAVAGIPGVKVSKFVGQGSRGRSKARDRGMSQKKQLEVLGRFRAGELNTLVATNVAEEGLDVAECDLVVMYDVVPSEIRMIQREGRTARHRAGRVVVLYTRGTRDELNFGVQGSRRSRMRKTLASMSRNRQVSGAGVGGAKGDHGARSSGRVVPAQTTLDGAVGGVKRRSRGPRGALMQAHTTVGTLQKAPVKSPVPTRATSPTPPAVTTVRLNPLHGTPWDLAGKLGSLLAPTPVHLERCTGSLEVTLPGGGALLVGRFVELRAGPRGSVESQFEAAGRWADGLRGNHPLVLALAVDDSDLPTGFREREGVISKLEALARPARVVVVDSVETLALILNGFLRSASEPGGGGREGEGIHMPGGTLTGAKIGNGAGGRGRN